MITITYDDNLMLLLVEGHAGCGKKGEDVVCAAVSMLFYTLEANLRKARKQGYAEQLTVHRADGEGAILCEPSEKAPSVVWGEFTSIVTGFRLLARRYPKHVRFRQVTEGKDVMAIMAEYAARSLPPRGKPSEGRTTPKPSPGGEGGTA